MSNLKDTIVYGALRVFGRIKANIIEGNLKGNADTATNASNSDKLNGLNWTDFARVLPSREFGGNMNVIDTPTFVTMLVNLGAFNQPYWICRAAWSYAGNQIISTGVGEIHLAGATVEVMSQDTSAYTIRLHTSNSSGKLGTQTASEFIYINNGDAYNPGWRKIWNSATDGHGSGSDADVLDGVQGIGALDVLNSRQYFLHDGAYNTNKGNGSVANLDDAVYPGYYHVNNSVTSNTPVAASGHLWVWRFAAENSISWIVQEFIPTSTTDAGTRFFRTKEAGTWKAWRKIWDSANDGTGSGLDADKLHGFYPNTAAVGNTIVQRDTNGYIFGSYFNSSRGIDDNIAAESYIFDSGDGYMRKRTVAKVREDLGGHGKGFNADTVDDIHGKNLARSGVYTAGTDMNTMTTPGFYTGYQLVNAPNSGWLYITVEAHGDGGGAGWYKQTVTSYGSDNIAGYTYMRLLIGATNWTAWKKVWSEFNHGVGSGLDANLLNGIQGSEYITKNLASAKSVTGTATAITIDYTVYSGCIINFICKFSVSGGVAITINGISLYKENTTIAPNLIAGRAYTVYYNGTSFFLKASAVGTAIAGEVLAGKTFSNDNDVDITGTIPIVNGDAYNHILAGDFCMSTAIDGSLNAFMRLPEGKYLAQNAQWIRVPQPNIVAQYIMAGKTIFGVGGNFTADATAAAANILSGKTAYVNGAKVTGDMPDMGATAITNSATVRWPDGSLGLYLQTSGYYRAGAMGVGGTELKASPSQLQAADSNFISGNIKSGVSIFGVTGDAQIAKDGFVTSSTLQSNYTLINNQSYPFYTVVIPGSMIDYGTVIVHCRPAYDYEYITIYDAYSGRVFVFTVNGSTSVGMQSVTMYTLDSSACLYGVPVQLGGASYRYYTTDF